MIKIKYKYVVIFICFVAFTPGCNSNDFILLVQKGTNKKIHYPESVNITCKGYEIGKAELLDSNGTYKLQDIQEGVCFLNSSKFYIQKTHLIGLNYEIIVDTIRFDENYCFNKTDTFYYSFYEQDINNKNINNALNSLKEVLDTLREFTPSEKLDKTEQAVSPKPE